MSRGKRSEVKGYFIPREETITEIIEEVLDGNVTISSQRRLHSLIMGNLRERNGGEKYRLSARRLRRIAATMDSVDLIIHCREGKRKYRGKSCPVCGSDMESVKNATLYGWTVSTGKICNTCGYWTGKKRRIPVRYVFTTEKESYLKRRRGGAR